MLLPQAEPQLGATFWRILELEWSAAAWSMHSMMTGRRRDVSRRRMEMLDRRLEEARRDLAAKTGATGVAGAQGGAGRQGRSTVSLAADQQRARQAEIDLLQVDFERTKSWAAKIGGYASYSNALAGRLRREVVEILDREAAAGSKGAEGGAGGQALAASIFPDLPEAVLPWGALAAYTKSHRKVSLKRIVFSFLKIGAMHYLGSLIATLSPLSHAIFTSPLLPSPPSVLRGRAVRHGLQPPHAVPRREGPRRPAPGVPGGGPPAARGPVEGGQGGGGRGPGRGPP